MLQRQPSALARPPVQSEHLAAALRRLAIVLGDAALDLGKGGAHDLAEVALRRVSDW